MTNVELYLFGAAVLLILCVFASKATGRLGVPTLVVFLAVGILAGSEGIGQIYFDDAYSTQSLGILALSYILFSGGLDTKWNHVRPIVRSALSLSTIGVLCTCLFVGLFIHHVMGFRLLESFLIGAIISSTDAGAVFTVLHAKSVHLRGSLGPLLEVESGSNDPMAVFLTTTLLSMMSNPSISVTDMIPLLIMQMSIGAIMGLMIGKALVMIFNKIRLEIEGLYIVLSVSVVIFIYSATQALKGNGFLAVYLAGVVLGNNNYVFKKSLGRVHDGISWLMQSAMFLTLGLLINPTQVWKVAYPALLISVFMIVIARPLSIFISLIFSKFNVREKTLVSWVGLRGSVPVVLATYPLVAGIDRAGTIFNIVFFVCLTSLIIQGTTIPFVSKLLGVHDTRAIPKPDYSSTPGSLRDLVMVDVPKTSQIASKSIVDLGIEPSKVLIVGIERNGEVIIPKGSTTIQGDDKLSVMADDDCLADFVEMIYSTPDDGQDSLAA
jgi:cell volume regulation protein A